MTEQVKKLTSNGTGVDVFVVESPFQAISALEARTAFNSPSTILVTVGRAGERSLAQIEVITSQVAWDSKLEIAFEKTLLRQRPTNLVDVLSELRSQRIRHLFLGYIGGLYSHLANTLPHDEAVLLDDGIAVLEIFKSRNAGRRYRDAGSVLRRVLLPTVERVVDGMNTCQRHPLSYFSIYELPESFGARVYRNNCQFTKAHARDQKSGEEVWILGTPMKEKEMMPFDRYLNCLRTIVRSLPGVTVVYIPHRAENGETLERLQAAVPVAVRRLGTAVEFHLARTSVIPRAVCGFFSSALFSVSRLFEGRIDVRAYYIPPEWLGRRHRAGISGAYEYFRSYGGPALRVVDLELTGV